MQDSATDSPPAPTFSRPLDWFLCSYDEVLDRLDAINATLYPSTRNHLDGHVTWLSPFLTHGIISTRQVADAVLARHSAKQCTKLIYELAWREFFHRTWQDRGDVILTDDLRAPQPDVAGTDLPEGLLNASTGIEVIDDCLRDLFNHGTMHNHARMWVASLATNIAHTNWREPARWLHYHLLDGDLASNTLSWQWVAGAFSHKRYLANQENVDKYSGRSQSGSWLDVTYEALETLPTPPELTKRAPSELTSAPPGVPAQPRSGAVALRSIWNLDPAWRREDANHVVFVDTELHQRWPLSPNRWRFVEHWVKELGRLGRKDIALERGTVAELTTALAGAEVVRREYPATNAWPGDVDEREWLFTAPDERCDSFSRFFKKVRQIGSGARRR